MKHEIYYKYGVSVLTLCIGTVFGVFLGTQKGGQEMYVHPPISNCININDLEDVGLPNHRVRVDMCGEDRVVTITHKGVGK
jgi:hypothetical protein